MYVDAILFLAVVYLYLLESHNNRVQNQAMIELAKEIEKNEQN